MPRPLPLFGPCFKDHPHTFSRPPFVTNEMVDADVLLLRRD